ncbi:MAG TPA: AAA family ATPase [Candidatus Nanopelagicales bacterium]|nr:AAA family ATPase [Candidatus Nanopelagicales bacterium]
MAIQVPLGIDDFRMIRERGLDFVDKSGLICQLVDRAGLQVVLLPRPRRFGKTVNLSMLRWFFGRSEEDLSHLFTGLQVWEAGEPYRQHFQRYPVIDLTFKEVKYDRFDACWAAIREKIRDLYDLHREVLESGGLSRVEEQRYTQILEGTAEGILYDRALGDLSRYVSRHHRQPVVILIDEYDTPIHEAYLHGYAKEVLQFFRAFLTGGLKGNPHLFKGVLTGILRVARESLFSGLNNLMVYSLLRPEFSEYFGFTEPEVDALLRKAGRADQVEVVREWYDGYDFGGRVIYNPWSVLSFVAQQEPEPQPFWLATSSNDLLKELLVRRAGRVGPTLELLLEGGSLERAIDEHVVLSELEVSEGAFWSLLVFAGYLRAEKRSHGPGEVATYQLSIPNREVRTIYTDTFRGWLKARLEGRGGSLEALQAALLSGDAAGLEAQLQAFAESLLSYHDVGGATPEQFYHGFVLGLFAAPEPEYQVRSNRESGEGRPDVMVRPARAGGPGVVLELKVARAGKKTLEEALEEGARQIRERGYAGELAAAGVAPVFAMAVAFDGKTVRVREA